jgi:hypothetical protein
MNQTMPDYLPDPYLSEDEDGFPWDCDLGGDLGNYDEDD